MYLFFFSLFQFSQLGKVTPLDMDPDFIKRENQRTKDKKSADDAERKKVEEEAKDHQPERALVIFFNVRFGTNLRIFVVYFPIYYSKH